MHGFFLMIYEDCLVCLQNVFPGLWLVGVTPDSYRLPDAPAKVPFLARSFQISAFVLKSC